MYICISLQKSTNFGDAKPIGLYFAKKQEKSNFDILKQILVLTNPDHHYIPLFNHLRPFFNDYDWTIAKCNAFIKDCIQGTVSLKEAPILEDLLKATKLTHQDEITIHVTKPTGFDETTIE